MRTLRRLIVALVCTGCGGGTPPPEPGQTLLYPEGAVHSPIDPSIVDNIRAIAARKPSADEHHYIKVGDSLTYYPSFMWPFSGAQHGFALELGAYTDMQPDIDWFHDHYHNSKASWPGSVATWATDTKSPEAVDGVSPLDQEIADMNPRFALPMFGTNDSELARMDPEYIHVYAAAVLDMVDYMIGRGIVPIMVTIPPNDNHLIPPTWWAITRGIAQGRRLPFVDLKMVLLTLPNWGLLDGIHLNFYPAAPARGGGVFTPTGLLYGNNIRNLITMQALARARLALAGTASDDTVPRLPATGTLAKPIPIPELPFADMRDTAGASSSVPGVYPGGPAKTYAGRGFAYELSVADTTIVRATVFVRGAVDVDIFALKSGRVLAGGDRELYFVAPPGTFVIVVDSVAGKAGEYLLTVVAERP